jgi:hypothetical protein
MSKRGTIVQKRRRGSPNSSDKYLMSFRFTCLCGQEREVSTTRRLGTKSVPGHFIIPCCLRRYDIVEWKDGNPGYRYYGQESWKTGKCIIKGPRGENLPRPGVDNTTEEHLAYLREATG